MAHQKEGVAFLLERRSGILAFEQGLGKTLVALEAFRQLRARERADTMVVICPNSLKRNWAEESGHYVPELGVCIVSGTARDRRRLLTQSDAAVVLINYEAARNDIAAVRALMQRRRSVLVLDESHYVKNLRSLNAVAAQHFAPLTRYRWLLTGTPVTNGPSDIYSQVTLVAGEHALGPFDAFMLRYEDAGQSPALRQELASRINAYLLRKTKDECLDLPDKTYVDLFTTLPGWQRKLYDGTRDDIVQEVRRLASSEFTRFGAAALARLVRLSQVASNPALVYPGEQRVPGKVAELDRLLDELVEGSGRKVIVWSHYVGTIQLLSQRYARLGAMTLYGATPVAERQDVVRRFQEDPAARVIIGNPAAGGVGFTLTAASYAIYETLTWRYDLYAQSQDRIHRIGQKVPVTYVRLIAEDTIDQVITEALARKEVLARDIVGDDLGTALIAQMTPGQFCEMLQTNALPDLRPRSWV